MAITLNGETRRIDESSTVLDLLRDMGLTGKRVAVECNGEIVPRSRHGATRFTPGDAVEVVGAVGGG
ncbi:MAG: sulfur carrier protein ThiS [Proteobacteria bacterium]|nr:sulfur carrier protein ThiS [Pseudomonadota bacterium]